MTHCHLDAKLNNPKVYDHKDSEFDEERFVMADGWAGAHITKMILAFVYIKGWGC